MIQKSNVLQCIPIIDDSGLILLLKDRSTFNAGPIELILSWKHLSKESCLHRESSARLTWFQSLTKTTSQLAKGESQ